MLRDASKGSGETSFSKSQYSGSKQHDTLSATDTRVTWSTVVNQVGRKAAQRLRVLGSLLNRMGGLSIRNGVLL
jgi:hypothetical protein